MNDIEQKALALVNEVARELGWGETKEIFAAGYTRNEALFRAIEQHEAFRQEVSDIVSAYAYPTSVVNLTEDLENLKALIIPAPKPDPLVEVLNEAAAKSSIDDNDFAAKIRAALEARGLEIREKNDD